MHDAIESIREQIHEIRNILGPIDIKLENLGHQITTSQISSETKISGLESKVAANTLRISEQALKLDELLDELALQSERIKQIELFLKIPLEKPAQAPVHEDKANPSILPPQTPPV